MFTSELQLILGLHGFACAAVANTFSGFTESNRFNRRKKLYLNPSDLCLTTMCSMLQVIRAWTWASFLAF